MRAFCFNTVAYREQSVTMASVVEEWGEDDVVVAAIRRGEYGESEALTWWLGMCSSAPQGSMVVDAGSYTGLYSLITTRLRSDLRSVAFEASAMTYGRAALNVILNKMQMRILMNHFALSEKSVGTLPLAHGYGVYTMASGESLAANYAVDHEEIVPTISLDRAFCMNCEDPVGNFRSKSWGALPVASIAAMKVDVEGVELSVLQGAAKLLETYRPGLVVEILGRSEVSSVASFLAGYGYIQAARCEGENLVFIPAEKEQMVRGEYERWQNVGDGAFRMTRDLEKAI
jgi:hypothetical protein